MKPARQLSGLLMGMGLGDYEARAYLALLAEGPSTAYGVAKAAGLPTSKIYQTIRKLERRDLVHRLANSNGRGTYYRGVPGQKFVTDTLAEQKQLGDQLVQALDNLAEPADDPLILNLHGWDEIRDRAAGMIDAAKKTVLISGWPKELLAVAPHLLRAHERGCRIAMVHYGPAKDAWPFVTYIHRQEQQIVKERRGRTLCLTADGYAALIAHLDTAGEASAGYSYNRTFIGVTEDFIRHDIYFLKVMKRFRAELSKRFGDDLRLLRDPFSDDEREATR
jgi:HTH-type transcriptional regulator, sugar sensing transcriptional regulator